MAHVTIAGKDTNVDSRLANLRKDILPGRPFQIAAQDERMNRRRQGRCGQCGQYGSDACCCHSHNTFISRGDGALQLEPLNIAPKAVMPQLTKTTGLEHGVPKSNGKKITFGDYKSRLKNSGGASVSPGTTPRPSDTVAVDSKFSRAKEAALHKVDSEDERPTKKQKLSPPIHESPRINVTAPPPRSPPTRIESPRPPFSSVRRSPHHEDNGTRRTATSSLARDRSPAGRKSPTHTSTSKSIQAPTTSRFKSSTQRNQSPPTTNRKSQPDIEVKSKDLQDEVHKRNQSVRHNRDGSMDHSSSEAARPKSQKRANEDLPPLMSPLPDFLNRLVDDYEKNAANKESKKEEVSYKKKKAPSDGTPEIHSTKKGQSTDTEATKRPESGLPSSRKRIQDDGESRALVTKTAAAISNGVPSYTAQKGPSKRLPASSPPHKILNEKVKPAARTFRSNRLVVKLRYERRISKTVARILRADPVMEQEDSTPAARKQPALSAANLNGSPPGPNSFLSPMPKASNGSASLSKSAATPNRKAISSKPSEPSIAPTPTTRPGTSMSGSTASGDRDTYDSNENDHIKAESDWYMNLGIKLKHESDNLLGIKTDGVEVDLQKGAVYAIHGVVAYFLAYGLEDELRRREKRHNSGEKWRQIMVYIEFLLNSRLKANLPLHGLLYQLGAICSEKVLATDQYRLNNLSLNTSSSSNSATSSSPDSIPATLITNLRKIQTDIDKSFNNSRNWWLIGHQRLPYTSLFDEYPKAWKRKSRGVVGHGQQQRVTVGYYLVPYYLPLFSGSTPFEAASFAWYVTEEWCQRANLVLNTGLLMKKKEDF